MEQEQEKESNKKTKTENSTNDVYPIAPSELQVEPSMISKSSYSLGGLQQVNNCLRSVLIHPVCFPLLIYLNDVAPNSAHPEYVWTALNDFVVCDNQSERENVLRKTVQHWTKGEAELTKMLVENIISSGIGESLLVTAGEKKVSGELGKTGKVDFIFHEKEKRDNHKSSVVALFEFGLGNEMWWTKQDQILKYTKMLRTGTDQNYKIDQPVLLSVVTINETSSACNNFQEHTEETLTSDDPFKVRFGVFLCIPKDGNEFRIALLWRQTTKTLKEASTHFGKVLYAVQLCLYLRNYCNDKKDVINYKYLGPNCCKIGDLLYRSYDNRLRPTERRPDLYRKEITINNVIGPIAESVLELIDESSSLDFGKLNSTASADILQTLDWLWEYKGKLLIISTAFHNGVHFAQSPMHFKPIIEHLAQLHAQGYVHGDIRAYNMVLQYKLSSSESDEVGDGLSNDSGNHCAGWLIDFDYGGIHGEVEYPKGYRKELLDGRRPGKEGNKITIMDDWKSLIGLIFHTHIFVKKQEAELTNEQELSLLRQEKELQNCSDMEVEQVVFLLQEFIDLTSIGYKVTLHFNFEEDLKECGLLPTSKHFNASQAATGSPPKYLSPI